MTKHGFAWPDDQGIDEYPSPEKPREGYWSIFSVIGWIASRQDKFVAAVQVWEEREFASRGSNFSAAAFVLLGLEISERYGLTADECISKLRETLESGTSLQDCTAIDRQSGSLVKIEREHWRLWRLNCSHWGVELLPGLSDFRFPAEQVRAAFPPLAAPLPETSEGAVKVNGPSYRRKTITPQQNRIGLFLAFVDTHAKEKPEHSMRNFTQSRLHEEYKVWNHRRNKDPRCSREVPAVKLSGFKRWAKRYHDGERWV